MKKTHRKTHKKLVHIHSLFIFCAMFLLSFIAIVFYVTPATPSLEIRQEFSTNLLNPIDQHITQYSDKHITINAIDSNEKFSRLTLVDFIKDSNKFISPASQIAGIGKIPRTTGKEYGTWIWTPLLEMSREYINSIISGAKENGINTIYVSVDSYLDIYVIPNGSEKENKKKEFSDKLEYFVTQAAKKDIAIDAEAGWRNWAEDGNQYKAFAVINFVKEFNSKKLYGLRGFQYDIEPYLLATYKKDQTSVLKNFLGLIYHTKILLGASDLKFSVVIPDFYDKTQNLTYPFKYNGKTTYVYNHLLDILENRPGSSIIVMSYRNFADGDDGSIDISNIEVETATNNMYSTKIIIAQETGDVLPPYITFNNTNKNYYSKQINKINTAFDPYSNFGGIAVHYVNAFLSLK